MRKRLCTLLSAFLMLLCSFILPVSGYAVRGDLNGDNAVSVADAVMLCRILAEDIPDGFDSSAFNSSDFDEDGMLTILDVIGILQNQRPAETTAVTTITAPPETTTAPVITEAPQPSVVRNGTYTTKDDVALYLHLYGCLPPNFITKAEAQALGWSGGSLEPYAPGCCIGGSYFGNYEGLLPEKAGREYHECDIDTLGQSSRGAKRLVYSNDGLIYYTEDHYASFVLLYGTP